MRLLHLPLVIAASLVAGCVIKNLPRTEVVDGYKFIVVQTEIDNLDTDDEYFYTVTFPDGQTYNSEIDDKYYDAQRAKDKMIRRWIDRQKTLPGRSATVAGPPEIPANVPPAPGQARKEVEGGD